MAIVENTAKRLVFKSGSTTLILDKTAGKIMLQRKMLFWQRAPMEAPLADLTEISLDTGVDRASGIEVCNTMVIFRDGKAWALSAENKQAAEADAAALRKFTGLGR